MIYHPEIINNYAKNVRALATTRLGGASLPPFDSFNLANHVGDDIKHVHINHALLAQFLPANPSWLKQTHSNKVLNLNNHLLTDLEQDGYDASLTSKKHVVCAILTADCLPILVSDTHGSFVAAIHAGWRGLLTGIINNTFAAIHAQRTNIQADFLVYIGSAICQQHFVVGEEVYAQFVAKNNCYKSCFFPVKSTPQSNKLTHYHANLQQIATLQLLQCGVFKDHIQCSQDCGCCQPNKFYSYRHNNLTGRMAHLIWKCHC